MDTVKKPATQNKKDNTKDSPKLTSSNKLNEKSQKKGKKEHLP